MTSRGSEDAVLFGPALWKEPIATLQEILLYFSKEWAVLMSAPRTFVVLLVIGVAVGYAASSWYYRGSYQRNLHYSNRKRLSWLAIRSRSA